MVFELFFPIFFHAYIAEETPEASLKRNGSSKSSLWKDVSLFAKPEEAKKNNIAPENVPQPSNTNVTTKPTAVEKNTTDNILDPTPLMKSHQILSTKQQKPIEMTTPDDKRSPGCTKEKSTQVIKDAEIGSKLEPGDNMENKSPSKERNQVSSFIFSRYGCSTRVCKAAKKVLNALQRLLKMTVLLLVKSII